MLILGLLAVWLPPGRDEIRHVGEYYALMLLSLTGLLLATGTNHLLFLFVSLELASLSLYLLAGFSQQRNAAEASLKYFLFGAVSSAFLWFGVSLLFGVSGGVSLASIGAAVSQAGMKSSPLAIAGLAMVLAGLGFKLAAAPFHSWAPDVYQGAPAPSVALVASASKVTVVVVLCRLLGGSFGALSGSAAWGHWTGGWSLWLAVLAVVSILVGNGLALAQTSVRRLLAYSAIANAGYLLVALCANGQKSLGAAVFYAIVYALATFGALAVTAAVERSRGSDSLTSFSGLVQRSPFQALCLLVCLTSLAGIPPLAGFFGKFAMFSNALLTAQPNQPGALVWLVGFAAFMSAVSLYYYLGVLKMAFVTPATDSRDEPSSSAALSLSHRLAILTPAVALVLLGLQPDSLLRPIWLALGIVP